MRKKGGKEKLCGLLQQEKNILTSVLGDFFELRKYSYKWASYDQKKVGKFSLPLGYNNNVRKLYYFE